MIKVGKKVACFKCIDLEKRMKNEGLLKYGDLQLTCFGSFQEEVACDFWRLDYE